LKLAAFACLAALALAGCSSDLLRLRHTGPPSLPEKPTRSYGHETSIRALADWSARMLGKVHGEGAPRAAPAVGQAAEAAHVVSADVGPPADPLPLPPPEDYGPVEEADDVIERAAEQRSRHEERLWQWGRALERYGRTAVRREWSLGVPLAASALLALLVGLALRYGLKWRSALYQVFLGVRRFLLSPSGQETGDALKESLRGSMDQAAKDAIQAFYRRLGE
jgi:hypothetical protein